MTQFRKALGVLARLHRDERGAEGLEKLLIVGAIVIPLLALLIVFRNKLAEWVSGSWDTVRTDADQPLQQPTQ